MQELECKSKKKNVLTTDRDLTLLRLLYDHPALTLEQIGRHVFDKKSWPTMLNRLRQLEDGKLIERISVGRFKSIPNQKNVSVLVKLGRNGSKELARRCALETFSENVADIKQSQLDHDLMLVDVVEKLKKEHRATIFMSGRRFLRGKTNIERVPDFVMQTHDGSCTSALELELTAKSEKRYRQIVLSYRLSRHFDQVLFVTAFDTIRNKIRSEIVGRKVIENENLETGKFKFRSLKDFLN